MVKVLSNFDTQAPTKNYAEAVQEFGFDKVVFLRRHKLYFYLYTLTPACLAVVLLGFMLYSMYITPASDIGGLVMHRSSQIILLLLIFYLLIVARSKYFNYTLDYSIITPTYISSYNQKGILSREIRTIEPSKIKTIDFSSRGLINSLFNFGKVIILLEGDESGQGEIRIDFIQNPEGVKKSIQNLTEHAIISHEKHE